MLMLHEKYSLFRRVTFVKSKLCKALTYGIINDKSQDARYIKEKV